MTRAPRAAVLVVLAGLVAALLAGCVSMPRSGPVVETTGVAGSDDGRATAIDPLPPQPGASAVQVAEGFLEAMTATPIQVSVAQQYLTRDAATSWSPDTSTVIYDDARPPVAVAGGARITLTSAERLDGRGAWVGDLGPAASTLRLPMSMEDGEWRIARPPDALVVPASWFEQRFREVSLYFFDPTAQILVPESVFVPRGEQLASSLVEGLLQGPARGLGRVTRTFIPDGLDVGLSVPISPDGVAEIELSGDAPARSTEANGLMLAQLAWTLRQDPSIAALRVSIGGQQVTLPDAATQYRVDAGAQYNPTGYQSSTLLYGLDGQGRLLSGNADALTPVSGPLGRRDAGLRSLAVDPLGARAAGVDRTGTRLLEAPVRAGESPGAVREVLDGASDLLAPAWDYAGRLWVVDRTDAGARVSVVDRRGRAREVDVPGVTGRTVTSFVVSRDATRLVAAVRQGRTDRLHTARIRVDDQGRVVGAVRAGVIGSEEQTGLRVSDLVWSSASTVAVLSRIRRDLAEVRTVTVDGAPSGLSTLSTTLQGPVRFLVGSPVPGLPTFGLTRDGLVDVSAGSVVGDPGPLRDLAYAG